MHCKKGVPGGDVSTVEPWSSGIKANGADEGFGGGAHDGAVDHRVFVVGTRGKAAEMLSQIPHLNHRLKRRCAFFRSPKRFSRSRHTMPGG